MPSHPRLQRVEVGVHQEASTCLLLPSHHQSIFCNLVMAYRPGRRTHGGGGRTPQGDHTGLVRRHSTHSASQLQRVTITELCRSNFHAARTPHTWSPSPTHAIAYVKDCVLSLTYKYSGQDPQRLTCKKVPSPRSIREMSTLKVFKWLLMHQKCPQVCISYGKYGPPIAPVVSVKCPR